MQVASAQQSSASQLSAEQRRPQLAILEDSLKLGDLPRGPHNKDYGILGLYWGPLIWKTT